MGSSDDGMQPHQATALATAPLSHSPTGPQPAPPRPQPRPPPAPRLPPVWTSKSPSGTELKRCAMWSSVASATPVSGRCIGSRFSKKPSHGESSHSRLRIAVSFFASAYASFRIRSYFAVSACRPAHVSRSTY